MKKTKAEKKKVKVCFPADLLFTSGIREFFYFFTNNLSRFSEKWAFRFQTVADELCTNAIEHGSQSKDLIWCEFITIPEKMVEIIVEDCGNGIKTSPQELEKFLQSQEKVSICDIKGIRKRGLAHVVAKVMDKVTFKKSTKGGIYVCASKFFEKT